MTEKKYEFEIEHWPNPFGKHALKRMLKGYIKAYIFFGAIFIISFGLALSSKIIIGVAIPYTMWIARVTAYVLILGPILPFLSYLQRDKKHPSYGINKDGFFLNERGWNSTFFTWDEIAWIKEYQDPKLGRELHFEFVNFTKALNKDPKFAISLRREYETEKLPKRITSQLVKGDIGPFIDQFIAYYNEYKRKNPDLDQAGALELAKAYANDNHYEFDFNQVQYDRKEEFMNLKNPVWLISSNGNTIVVEIFTKNIPFVVDQDGKKKFPHMG